MTPLRLACRDCQDNLKDLKTYKRPRLDTTKATNGSYAGVLGHPGGMRWPQLRAKAVLLLIRRRGQSLGPLPVRC